MSFAFNGGVHPDGNKTLTSGRIPETAPIHSRVIIPMSQHIGAPCTPMVNVGDSVKLGQKIGEGSGLCVPVHASVSGVVEEIREMPHPGGGKRLAVVIRNDYMDTPANELTAHLEPEKLTQEQLLSIIHEAGVVGMGGATFPTDVKAKGGIGTVDVLIANACECEPFITADDTLISTYPEIILRGMRILRQIHGEPRTILAIEDNKKDAIRIIAQHLKTQPDIELCVLPTRYPQGAEKQLIKTVTGREVPPGKLPKDVGCAVFNVATCASVYKAVYEGMPVINRIVTVTGDAVQKPKNMLVRIGTPFSQVIEDAGGLKENAEKVLAGGPMMGVSQTDLSVPVVKGTNAIVCLGHREQSKNDGSCIRCGRCVKVCPMRLQPLNLYRSEAAGDFDEMQRLHLSDCIECGCCAYSCPAKLPLVERFRAGKRALKEGGRS